MHVVADPTYIERAAMPTRLFATLIPSLCLCAFAHAEVVTIPSDVAYADGADVRDAIKQECELETLIPEYIERGARKSDIEIVLSDDPGSATGKVLQLEITYVLAPGGGGFSGPKSVTVRGELRDNGEVIGSFQAARFSTRGSRTCTILDRCVRAIGEDIAAWLENPSMDAKLGNA